jgi:hypothetical protein
MLPVAESVPTHAYQQVHRVRPRSEAALIRGALARSEADLELLFRAHWPRAYRSAFPRGQRVSLCNLPSCSAGWRRDALPVLAQIAAEPRNPEASTDLASVTVSGDQEEPGVHAMRVPLAHGSSHDLTSRAGAETAPVGQRQPRGPSRSSGLAPGTPDRSDCQGRRSGHARRGPRGMEVIVRTAAAGRSRFGARGSMQASGVSLTRAAGFGLVWSGGRQPNRGGNVV